MPFVFASTGIPGRLGLVHLDVIEAITSSRSYTRTDSALELGTPVTSHRQRIPWVISVSIVISDVSPIAGAILLGLWEFGHAKRTRDQLYEAQRLGIPLPFFDGREIWSNPSGGWVIDNIDDGKKTGEDGVYRAVLTLGELPRFATLFTPFPPGVDDALTDSVDGAVDKGTQSLEDIPVDIAAEIPD
jgi:hypothetical protein